MKVRDDANALPLQEWQDVAPAGCVAPVELNTERKEWQGSLVGNRGPATTTP